MLSIFRFFRIGHKVRRWEMALAPRVMARESEASEDDIFVALASGAA